MECQRFEVTLRCGSNDSVMWTNRLEELEPVLRLAITGSQSSWRMGCAVRDTATGAHAEATAATPIGFTGAVDHLMDTVRHCNPRRVAENEGRDVVLEVQLAAHGATLEQCREFVCNAVEDAMSAEAEARDHGAPRKYGTAEFSPNGPTVGQAWFQ